MMHDLKHKTFFEISEIIMGYSWKS
jgi:hypothetical protein